MIWNEEASEELFRITEKNFAKFRIEIEWRIKFKILSQTVWLKLEKKSIENSYFFSNFIQNLDDYFKFK